MIFISGRLTPDFEPRILWNLPNSFTSAFKDLEPIPQFKATAKLSGVSAIRTHIVEFCSAPLPAQEGCLRQPLAASCTADAEFAQARKRRNEVAYVATPHSIGPLRRSAKISTKKDIAYNWAFGASVNR
jgi:hypothetical protein